MSAITEPTLGAERATRAEAEGRRQRGGGSRRLTCACDQPVLTAAACAAGDRFRESTRSARSASDGDAVAGADRVARLYGAFPRLSDEQIAALETVGERRRVKPGDVLYREGDGNCDFFVILEGKVAVVEESGAGEQVIGVHGPRRFLGELGLVTGQAVFVYGGRARARRGAGRPAGAAAGDRHPGSGARRSDPAGLMMRRSILIGLGVGFRIVGSRYSPDTRRLRDFAIRNRLPHHWIDLESDPGAEELLRRLGLATEECPIVLLGPGQVLRNPSNAELAGALGLRPPSASEATCDLIVVGAGPGGLAAAVYGASEGLRRSCWSRWRPAARPERRRGSRTTSASRRGSRARSWPSARRSRRRSSAPGSRSPARRVGLDALDGTFRVRLRDGESVIGRAVVIATGVRYRRLPVAGLAKFEGTSVHYAATQIEAQLCRGDPVVAVGGGNSAGQAALLLSRYVPHLSLVVREHDLGENMSRYLADRIVSTPTIEVLTHCEVRELIGDDASRRSSWRTPRPESAAGSTRARCSCSSVPNRTPNGCGAPSRSTRAATSSPARTRRPVAGSEGGNGARRSAPLLETSVPGVFAAGDVRSGSTQRVAAAVGDGAIAIRQVHQFLGGRLHAVRLAQTYVSSK